MSTPNQNAQVERVLQVLVGLAALGTIPLVIAETRAAPPAWVPVADWLVWSIFFVEYVILFTRAKDRRAYVRSAWLNAVIVVVSFPLLPAVFSLSRLIRLLRLARLLLVATKGVHALGNIFGRKGLLYMASVATLLVLAGGATLFVLEPESVDGRIDSGLWWAIVTTTTVGYGDIAPVTLAGRGVGVVLMLVGLGLVSTLAAAIAAHFVAQDDTEDLREIQERLARIEALLAERSAAPEEREGGG